jgi:hypothetical protein
MSIVIHPRRGPYQSQSVPTERGARGKWRFVVLILALLLGLAVGLGLLFRSQGSAGATGHGGASEVPVLAAMAPEAPRPPVTDTAEVPPAAWPQPAAPQEASAQAPRPGITFDDRMRMQREMRKNEALPPEERRLLAPTPDMLRTMDEERSVPQ